MGGNESERIDDRESRIQAIVAACRKRHSADEDFANKQIIDDHPDLMPELGTALNKLRVIAAARRMAVKDKAADDIWGTPPVEADDSQPHKTETPVTVTSQAAAPTHGTTVPKNGLLSNEVFAVPTQILSPEICAG